MNTKFLYGTVASAINSLRKAGFSKDFNLGGNFIGWKNIKMGINDLKIVTVCSYEGNSDPADKASVYGLESKTGLKGILITGSDTSSEYSSRNILEKLHLKFLNSCKKKEIF